MTVSRRKFLGAAGLAAAGAALSPLLRVKRAHGSGDFLSRRVVILGIGGGLRRIESLGMAEGATMPNLFGRVPLISGFGPDDAGDPRIAPQYAAAAPQLALPTPRPQPLFTEGSLITNLRYAEGAPGHLQGHACLLSGLYNNIENRADARLPVPTLFELHRQATNAPATDAWYVSLVGGFYSALQTSDHPAYGARFGGNFVSPPNAMSVFMPLITDGSRTLDISGGFNLPVIPDDPDERAAVGRLRSILDGNAPPFLADSSTFRSSTQENSEFEEHLAAIYSDNTYQRFFPDSFGIGLQNNDGGIDETGDAKTIYHAEEILRKFKPTVMAISLLDVDTCHADFNGYLRGQQVADACAAHLWDFIQATDGLRDETTLIILPEHGRHLQENGQNPDSLGRSGIDHGNGDDGDRDVWMLALGPDIRPNNVIAPTGITQSGRSSGSYETIDAVRFGAELLGYGDAMQTAIEDEGSRAGLMIQEICR